jgi:hypothetical protein
MADAEAMHGANVVYLPSRLHGIGRFTLRAFRERANTDHDDDGEEIQRDRRIAVMRLDERVRGAAGGAAPRRAVGARAALPARLAPRPGGVAGGTTVDEVLSRELEGVACGYADELRRGSAGVRDRGGVAGGAVSRRLKG